MPLKRIPVEVGLLQKPIRRLYIYESPRQLLDSTNDLDTLVAFEMLYEVREDHNVVLAHEAVDAEITMNVLVVGVVLARRRYCGHINIDSCRSECIRANAGKRTSATATDIQAGPEAMLDDQILEKALWRRT